MKISRLAVGSALLLATLCSAQETSTSASGENSDQSIAGAAAASRARLNEQQAKQEDIKRLLELTGSAGLAAQMMDEMEKSIKPLLAQSLPPGDYRDTLVSLFFEKFKSKRDPQQLVALITPIYEKYYSHDDIKQLIALYQSPIGQKMLSVLPKVAAESQAAGRAWGEQLGRQCMTEVLAEHPDLRQQMLQASSNTQH